MAVTGPRYRRQARIVQLVAVGLLLWPMVYALLDTDTDWLDPWLTADQQGRLAFTRHRYLRAASHFEDPRWKATSLYAGQSFRSSAKQFGQLSEAQGYFSAGNALAHAEDYKRAAAAYRKALHLQPDWFEAQENLELVEVLGKEYKSKEGEMQDVTERDLGADEYKFDPDKKSENGDNKGGEEKGLPGQEIASEIWMRNLTQTPADFLRAKFSYQQAERERQ